MQVHQSPIVLSANQLFVIDYNALFAVSHSNLHFNSNKKVCHLISFILSLDPNDTHRQIIATNFLYMLLFVQFMPNVA